MNILNNVFIYSLRTSYNIFSIFVPPNFSQILPLSFLSHWTNFKTKQKIKSLETSLCCPTPGHGAGPVLEHSSTVDKLIITPLKKAVFLSHSSKYQQLLGQDGDFVLTPVPLFCTVCLVWACVGSLRTAMGVHMCISSVVSGESYILESSTTFVS